MAAFAPGIQADRRVIYNGLQQLVHTHNFALLFAAFGHVFYNRKHHRFRPGLKKRHFEHVDIALVPGVVQIDLVREFLYFTRTQDFFFPLVVSVYLFPRLFGVRRVGKAGLNLVKNYLALLIKKYHTPVGRAGI